MRTPMNTFAIVPKALTRKEPARHKTSTGFRWQKPIDVLQSCHDDYYSWSTKIPFFGANYRHQVSADGSGIAVGGQHLVRAGDSIQAAADSINVDDYYACTALLREAGVSLAEVGEAWVEDNWEAVTYAADDCSASFQA
eukprot:scaffold24486_cov122-Cylindrotheca_fusiformis.AAC.1